MPACLQVVASQPAMVTADTPDQCSGYVLVTGTEYQNLQAVASIWQVPDTGDLQTAFMSSFTLVMVAYLSAWAYAQLINFLSEK
ncbi:hypothetical protein [Silvimonas soli]|uniref:hypothetical protein n=1 Tax=Silvimonas soli TaxID=2980100 RepID=UPI0024B33950|nr:hypothetical protein [Silvimonas soli]